MIFGKPSKVGSDSDSCVNLFIGPSKLEVCQEYDYLGVRIDNRLSFIPHIENVIRNCNARLCTLSKIRKYIDVKTAVTIYKSTIMSRLQYGLVFSVNALQKYRQKLQVIQNRALRICSLTNRYVSNYSLNQLHHVLPFNLRSKLDLLILMFKLVRRNAMATVYNAQRLTRLQTAPTMRVSRP